MKKLLRKKPDPPQQPAPPPTVQRSTPAPPPLFARFASSHSTGSAPSPPVISGPVPLAPRDSIHKQSGPHDGSPPKPSNLRLVAPPVQRNRAYEKQLSNDARGDKPLPDLGQTQTQRGNPHAFHREPVQQFESRTPMNIDDPPPTPQKSMRREDPPRNAEPSPVFLDTPSTSIRSESVPRKITRGPLSGSPERKQSTPAPGSEPPQSGLLATQDPSDRPQPRRKYSPLEAFGFVSGENSPVPSTTTSSVNLPSQSLVSTSSSIPFLQGYRILSCHYHSPSELFDTKLITTHCC